MEIFLVAFVVGICIAFWWFGFKGPELTKKNLYEKTRKFEEARKYEQERLAGIARDEKEKSEGKKAQKEQEIERRKVTERIEEDRKRAIQRREAEEKNSSAAPKDLNVWEESSLEGNKHVAPPNENVQMYLEGSSAANRFLIEKHNREKSTREFEENQKKLKLKESDEAGKRLAEAHRRLANQQRFEQDAKNREEQAIKDAKNREGQANDNRKLERETVERKAKKAQELAEAKAQAILLEQKALEAEKKHEAAKERRREADRLKRAELKAAAEKKKKSSQVDWHHPSALTLCEENTSYCNLLDTRFNLRQQSFSFDDIRSLSSAQGDHVFYQLQSGVKQLDSPEQLSQYIFSYGKMHKAKLYDAYSVLANKNALSVGGKQIEIFDYGCGQGIATVLLIDHLKACNNADFTLAQVVLIEPSVLALKRAALHVRYNLTSVNSTCPVAAYSVDLDSIESTHIKACRESIKFHLFSNILDVPGINLKSLQNKMLASLTGENYFICISPNINSDGRNQRIHSFYTFFQNSCNTKLITARDTDINGGGARPWTRIERVFHVNMAGVAPLPNRNQIIDDNDLPF